MTKVISIFTQKGGVGKTTTTINIMAELTSAGKKVLGIDVDAQGNLTRFLGVNTEDENTLLEVLSKSATFAETVAHTKYGDALGSDRNLQIFIKQFSSDVNSMFALAELVGEVKSAYDYILIDCPPSANEIAIAALIASDYVIVPTELEFFSVDGLVEISKTVEQVKKRLNPNLKILGAVFVKYKKHRKLTTQMESKCEELIKTMLNARVFDTRIREGTAVPCSQAMGLSLSDYDKAATVAEEYAQLAKEVLALCEV